MRIVIIGGVAAGMSAAAKARRVIKDAEIVVYERTDAVSWGACGLPYHVGGFFDDHNDMIARPVEKIRESGIEVNIYHEVTNVDAVNKKLRVKDEINNIEFEDSYDKLMIATGAHAVLPPIENIKLDNVFTLKELSDGINLKREAGKSELKDVVIIGAGYIGIEVVEAMKKLGKNVRLIQLDSRVLPDSFDKELTDMMEKEIIDHGIHLHLNETVKAFEGKNRVTGVITDKGTYHAGIVVICVGVRPNTGFLKEAGINMLGNGAIIINEYGETNINDIYAAGDCASVHHLVKNADVYIPLATTANKIGRIVGENLGGKHAAFQGTLGSAAIKVMDLEAARTGITENDAVKMGLNYKTVFVSDKNQTNYYPGQKDIHVKLVYDAESKTILGGQIIGEKGAVLRVDVLAAAIYSKLTTNQLGFLDLCYAPPFSRTWDVLNIAANAAK